MEARFYYNYAFIDVETGLCTGVVSSPREQNRPDSIPIESYNEEYLGKYYLDGSWYEKVWNEYDEDGNPVESSGYTMVPWSPSGSEV